MSADDHADIGRGVDQFLKNSFSGIAALFIYAVVFFFDAFAVTVEIRVGQHDTEMVFKTGFGGEFFRPLKILVRRSKLQRDDEKFAVVRMRSGKFIDIYHCSK